MKPTLKISLLLSIWFMLAFGGSGCFGGGGGGAVEYIPTWIAASWTGGATGQPTDRRDEEAEDWEGLICPASSIDITNHDVNTGFAGICIVNSCSETVSLYICRTKGTLDQPANGLQNYECADDPFETPFSRLYPLTLNPGPLGFCINATEQISINVFYCSDAQQLNVLETPLRCL